MGTDFINVRGPHLLQVYSLKEARCAGLLAPIGSSGSFLVYVIADVKTNTSLESHKMSDLK